MKGVWFNGWHSFRDFLLVLSSVEIEMPKLKSHTVDTPLIDGVIDFTEAFGFPRYKNRRLKFTFSTIVTDTDKALELYTQVASLLHGRTCDIVLDDDPSWIYHGRVSFGALKTKDPIKKIEVTCDCQPYKVAKTPKRMVFTSEIYDRPFVFDLEGHHARCKLSLVDWNDLDDPNNDPEGIGVALVTPNFDSEIDPDTQVGYISQKNVPLEITVRGGQVMLQVYQYIGATVHGIVVDIQEYGL